MAADVGKKTLRKQLGGGKIRKRRRKPTTEFFAKRLEKCNLLSNHLCKDVENLGCPKVSKMLNNSDTDWDCSNYPYRHKKTFHCAEKRAYAYGT